MFKLDYVNTKKAKKKLFMDTLFRIFVVFFLALCVLPKIISQFVFFWDLQSVYMDSKLFNFEVNCGIKYIYTNIC